MNLQTIQKRIEELQAELLTISNDLSFLIQGEVVRKPASLSVPTGDWAAQMEHGDTVVCVGFNTSNTTRLRCFTVGKEYTVRSRLYGKVGDYNYGVRILRDNEGEGHDASGVIFAKVGA